MLAGRPATWGPSGRGLAGRHFPLGPTRGRTAGFNGGQPILPRGKPGAYSPSQPARRRSGNDFGKFSRLGCESAFSPTMVSECKDDEIVPTVITKGRADEAPDARR